MRKPDGWLTLEIKAISEVGEFEGALATYGNTDLGGDILESGAFTKSLEQRKGRVRLLLDHDITHRAGTLFLTDSPTILHARGKLIMDSPHGQQAYAEVKHYEQHGPPMEMSVGFRTRKDRWLDGLRRVQEAELWEGSLVCWGMNPQAQVTAVKTWAGWSADETEAALDWKGVVPYQALPLASRNRAWAAAAAEKRVRVWADAEDGPTTAYRRAFLWFDGEASDQFGSYKLPYTDILDGELTAVPRALFAIAGVLNNARGGVDLPEADRARLKRLVVRWYARMRHEFDDDSLIAPWDQKGAAMPLNPQPTATTVPAAGTTEEKAYTFSDLFTRIQLWQMRGQMMDALWGSLDSILYDENLDPAAKRTQADTSLNEFHAQALTWLESVMTQAKALQSLMDSLETKTLHHLETKVGAKISKARLARLKAALEALQAVIEEAAPADEGEGEKQHPSPPEPTLALVTDELDWGGLLAEMRVVVTPAQ